MQTELDAEFPTLDFQLLGVNAFGQEAAVPTATQDRSIPMLQDVDSDGDNAGDVWGLWDVEWRDLVILDASNRKVGVINLTSNDLAESANYQAVKQMLLDAAEPTDQPGSISGYAFVDANQNGFRDAFESPIGNVQVVLSGTDLTGQMVQRTASTGADGSYRFVSVPAGTFTLQETQPVLMLDGRNSVGTAGGTSANDRFSVTLAAGVQAQNYNFGERGRGAATISLFDFFASTPRNGVVVAAQADSLSWFALEGTWTHEASETEVAVEAGAIQVIRTDSQGIQWEGHYVVSDRNAVRNLFQQNGLNVVRVGGELSFMVAAEADVTATSTAAISKRDGEGESASTLQLNAAIGDSIKSTLVRLTESEGRGVSTRSVAAADAGARESERGDYVACSDSQCTAMAKGRVPTPVSPPSSPGLPVQSPGVLFASTPPYTRIDRRELLAIELAFSDEDLLE